MAAHSESDRHKDGILGMLADIRLSVYVAIFLTLLSCFSAISYAADLFCQFRVQMAGGLAFMLLLLALSYKIKRQTKLLIYTASALVLNVVCVGWTFLPNLFDSAAATAPDTRSQDAMLKVLQFNLNNKNEQYSVFKTYALKLKPDVICLEELSSGWWTNIQAIKKEYPYQICKIREDSFGVAIFSRYPLQDAAIITLGKAGLPSAFARIEFGGKRWSFLVTHPVPPVNAQWYQLRNQQFKALAEFARADKSDHFVLAADLNCAPWSAHFINLLAASGLKDSRVGFGIEPSWPANCWILRIPLDHLLTTKNVTTRVRRVDQDLGSDHLPVYAEMFAQ